MKPGAWHTLEVTTEQLGYLKMATGQILRKDRKGARRFGKRLRQDSSLAHRLRVGNDCVELLAKKIDEANRPDEWEGTP